MFKLWKTLEYFHCQRDICSKSVQPQVFTSEELMETDVTSTSFPGLLGDRQFVVSEKDLKGVKATKLRGFPGIFRIRILGRIFFV